MRMRNSFYNSMNMIRIREIKYICPLCFHLQASSCVASRILSSRVLQLSDLVRFFMESWNHALHFPPAAPSMSSPTLACTLLLQINSSSASESPAFKLKSSGPIRNCPMQENCTGHHIINFRSRRPYSHAKLGACVISDYVFIGDR